MYRLLSLLALSAFLSFGQSVPGSAPAFSSTSGFDAPAVGNCAGPQNLGSQYNRFGSPQALYVCMQTGSNSNDQGSFTWVPLQRASATPTSGTLSVANSKAAVISNSLTFAGTDSTTMTFPGSSDTVVTLGATQTLTSKTMTAPALNNPVIVGPAPVACGASCSPTAGQLALLNQAAGSTVTLPTSAGTGNVIRMRISVATSSAAEKVLLTTTSDVIIGTAIGENAGTAKVFVGNAGTYHSIQMPNAGSQPSGGFIGDTITCTDIAAGTWACDVVYQAGTTPTTPYSTSTT